MKHFERSLQAAAAAAVVIVSKSNHCYPALDLPGSEPPQDQSSLNGQGWFIAEEDNYISVCCRSQKPSFSFCAHVTVVGGGGGGGGGGRLHEISAGARSYFYPSAGGDTSHTSGCKGTMSSCCTPGNNKVVTSEENGRRGTAAYVCLLSGKLNHTVWFPGNRWKRPAETLRRPQWNRGWCHVLWCVAFNGRRCVCCC